ncbi:MAG: VWA domain-containing protein [Acidobacteria bacterium]|nr:VWA domain-containing protein [Acidobacteriota bacterium]
MGFVHIVLPPGGEVAIENRRGGVRVEVWGEDYLALATESETPAPPISRPGKSKTARPKVDARRQSPARIERSESRLLISVPRASAGGAGRVELRVLVPASARLKVITSEGSVVVNGVPASLIAQSISGDMSVSFPERTEADITAQSLNGTVTLDAPGAPTLVLRHKHQAGKGNGGPIINLFSGRGRIRLEKLAATPRRAESPSEQSRLPTAGSANTEEPARNAPTLSRPAGSSSRPAPQVSESPQEVDEDEVVRVESDLVTLNVSVVERSSGRGLKGLAREDFRLEEDGVEQQIAHFESANAPFDLLLLIDLSGSTANVTDILRAAARRFVAATRAQDRVAVVAFSGTTAIVSPLTVDRQALDSAIGKMLRPQGDTRLYDAMDFAMHYLEREAAPSRRRAVILLSDGLDSTLPNVTGTGSTKTYEEVRDHAQEFDGVLYTIWTNTEEYEAFSPLDIQPETFDLAHDRMKELAGAGGGLFYEVERLEDLAGAYERVVADLGTVYSLSYSPSNKQRDGRWRTIRVRLPRHPAAVARGKRGYNAR